MEGLTREAVARAVSEAAGGEAAWLAKSEELTQGFLAEGVHTQGLELMLGFDTASGSLPVRRPSFRFRSPFRHISCPYDAVP